VEQSHEKSRRERQYYGFLAYILRYNCGSGITLATVRHECVTFEIGVMVSIDDLSVAAVCCVEEYIESSIMKSGVSFYATTSKGTLKNLKHCTGKVQLQDTKILDNAGIGDLVFKNSLDIVWILKDARFVSSLGRKLISVG
ncbi:hypothetical protein Tco_0054841, partial [Tanacetum coccineum]